MPVTIPFWFKQRQCKSEAVGADTLKVTGPNLPETYLNIRPAEGGRWQAALRFTADGPDVDITGPDFGDPDEAWEAAYELYRTRVIT
jgi:hypothetical protein